MRRTLAVFGLFFVLLQWNLRPPWLHQRPGRPVCIEFHPLTWTPVVTDDLHQPQVYFGVLLVGDMGSNPKKVRELAGT